ncbi:hypothetical protein [Nocardiopsis quinghaiensis]|uniref:hypothetical protein n=1 Tax=Nocardiopsis quinghaiensis TaxID=464995 RepID=UPI00123AD499|nr:hypothetical protein [Nocardiopsis quinghaiensis]
MSGVHGLTNASGVRSAVLPASARRALLLAALVFGVLAGAWLATSDSVLAQENPAPSAPAHGAGNPAHQAGPVVGEKAPAGQTPPEQANDAARPNAGRSGTAQSGTGQAGAAQSGTSQAGTAQSGTSQAGTGRPNAAQTTAADAGRAPNGRAGSVRTDASARTDTERHVPAAPARLDKPLDGAVAAAGRKTTRMVFDTPAAVPPAIGARGTRGNGVAQQVRDTVHGTPAFVEDRLATDAVSDTAPAAEEPSAEGTGPDGDARPREGGAVLTGPVHGADGTVATALHSTSDTAARYSTGRTAESAPVPLMDEAVASSAPNTTATGSAPSGATGGVAGYLPATGAPAPLPGHLQAAWHVLRSVPAESADEPTFSPD